ncbi:MAG: helix-turn-helix domain-containing protein [Haloarculaceae archaeon]
MTAHSNHRQGVELLQELGLTEHKATSFVALSRLPSGTAKEISDVLRGAPAWVYDAINVLENRGLVETQHSSPSSFAP